MMKSECFGVASVPFKPTYIISQAALLVLFSAEHVFLLTSKADCPPAARIKCYSPCEACAPAPSEAEFIASSPGLPGTL